MSKMTIGFVPIARPTFDVEFAQNMTNRARARLAEAGFELIETDGLVMSLEDAQAAAAGISAESPDLLLVFHASFADSTMMMCLAEWVDCPLLMWAVPEERTGARLRLNSLCGLNLAAHALTRKGYLYDYIYALPESDEAIEKIKTVALAASAGKKLQGTQIGRLGENPTGFETCIPNYDLLKNRLGVTVVQYDLMTFIDQVEQHRSSPGSFVEVAHKLEAQLENYSELDQTATHGTLATFVTLRELAAKDKLSGFAVRCWPEFFTDLGCAACGAMSMMSNDGTPCSCEADVNGTLTQVMLQAISGEAAFGSDIVAVDDERDGLVLWHCGLAPLSMADPASRPGVTIHSNRKLPLLFQFTLKPGRVTLARLSQAKGGWRLVVGEGEVQRAPGAFSGTTGVVRFERPAQDVLDTILAEGLEHHVSLTYGDHAGVLYSLAKMLELPVLVL